MIDPATLASGGQFLGGLGNLASGLFGSKTPGIDVSENYRLGLAMGDLIPRNIDKQVGGTMVAAKKHGVHPMYLLGSGVSGNSPSFAVGGGGSGGPNYGQAAEGLAQMGRAFGSKEASETDKAMTAMGLRQMHAETLKSEYGAELDWIQLQRARQQANSNQESAVTYRPDPDDVHRRTASGGAYAMRGGGVREDDLGGMWGELQNILHGFNDPALNPLAKVGKALGKAIHQYDAKDRQLRIKELDLARRLEALENRRRRLGPRTIYRWGK